MPSLRPSVCSGLVALAWAAMTSGCQAGSETFVGDRLPMLCDGIYWTCNVSAACTIDEDHFLEGSFPGTHRFLVHTDELSSGLLSLRLYFEEMRAPGTELLAQVYEPACLVDGELGRVHYEDVDLFDEAGDDRVLDLELEVEERGEHLVEIYSDASASFLLTVDGLGGAAE